ncbi:hypothetical protein ACKAV7_014066 [Fusarium commune]|nr:hypothetical protein LZL87_013516 [Fusarium oxysporum]
MVWKTPARVSTQVPALPSMVPNVPVFEDEDTFDANKEAYVFLKNFSQAIEEQNWKAFAELFLADGFWKDNLSITFDKRTLQGRETIVEAWKKLSGARKPVILTTAQDYGLGLPAAFKRMAPTLASLDVPFCFTTEAPQMNCVGLAKLIPRDGKWRIWLMSTAADSLTDSPFAKLPRQSPSLVSDCQRGKPYAQGLPDIDGTLDVVVVGASLGGVGYTIMLESIGANVVAFDDHEQAAGNWLSGGRKWVVLHQTPRKNELPQYPVPDVKDLGGGDVTEYVSAAVSDLKLPVFCGIKVIGNAFNEASGLWDVRIEDVKTQTRASVKSKNLVLAAAYILPEAYPYLPPLANRELFKGPVRHSEEYEDAEIYREKNVVVVGGGNSAHDIARNLVNGGAGDVTILQRGSTSFFKWEVISPLVDGPFASSLPIDTADFLFFHLFPTGIARDMARSAFAAMEAEQSDFYTSLENKGYSIQRNRDFVTGVHGTRNANFFMDRQKSLDLVLNDRIKVARGEARRFVPEGIVVYDGDESKGKVIAADGIVLATGYEWVDWPQRWAESGFIDRKSASLITNPGSMALDPEGEAICLPFSTGHPHLYYGSNTISNNRWSLGQGGKDQK